ncbi:MAG TPA: hypothetical protein VFW00_12630, partial [Rhodocyclaceae bacterium]|nr:hypothetical protein [Rhodocyclaceae bacterium]
SVLAESSAVVGPAPSQEIVFLPSSQVDYPAESINLLDLNAALNGIPIASTTTKFLLLIDERGVVRELQWIGPAPSSAIADSISEYMLQQPFHPARKNDQPVKSRLVFELDVGMLFSKQPEFSHHN